MESLKWLRSMYERIAPVLAGTLPVVGMLFLVVAAGFAVRSWNFARTRVRATATITENVSGFAKEGGVVYRPRFRFRLPSGELVTVQSVSGSEDVEFGTGDIVPVLYPVGDPQGAVIATAWRAYEGAIVWSVLGAILFDVGWALRVMLRRRVAVT